MDFTDATPDRLADRIAAGLRTPPEYRPVASGGPERAASMIAALL
jgi:hypothetical protein